MKMIEPKRISVSLADATAATGLSRRTLDMAVIVGILHPIYTGTNGGKMLLLMSELETVLTRAAMLGLPVCDDSTTMMHTKQILDVYKGVPTDDLVPMREN